MKKTLRTVCAKESLKDIRSFIRKSLEKIDFDAKTKSNMVLAVDEASANAIIHGNNCDSRREIRIDFTLTDQKIIIEIFDIGEKDFDQLKFIQRDIEELVKEKSKGGMGLKLMNSIMDEVLYKKINDTHYCVLIKNLNQ